MQEMVIDSTEKGRRHVHCMSLRKGQSENVQDEDEGPSLMEVEDGGHQTVVHQSTLLHQTTMCRHKKVVQEGWTCVKVRLCFGKCTKSSKMEFI